jgi:tetratricopeptide (TPR) repeat protein
MEKELAMKKRKKKKTKSSGNGKAILITAIAIIIFILLFKFVILGGGKAVSLANQGIDLLRDDKFFESEKKFADASREDPVLQFIEKSKEPSLAYVGLGNAALEKRDYLKAGGFYQNAYKLDSTLDFERYTRFARQNFNYPEPLYIELGNYFWEKGNLKLARIAYQRPLVSNPDMLTALTNLGNIERRLGNIDEAMHYYNRVLTIDPTAFEARVNLVSLAFVNEEFSVFEFQVDKLKEYHPEHAYTQYFLGQSEKRRKNYAKAIEYFNNFIEQRPDDLAARLEMVDCYVELEEFDKAQQIVEQMALKHGALRQIQEKALAPAEGVFRKEQFARSKGFYESLAAIWPNDPEFKFGIANCMLRLEEYSQAQAIMEELLQDYPKSSPLLTNLGILYAKIGRDDWAKEQFETAIALDSSAIAYYNLGKLFEEEGDSTQANSLFLTAALKDPEMFGLNDYMMDIKMDKADRIARGDTAGMIFLDQ